MDKINMLMLSYCCNTSPESGFLVLRLMLRNGTHSLNWKYFLCVFIIGNGFNWSVRVGRGRHISVLRNKNWVILQLEIIWILKSPNEYSKDQTKVIPSPALFFFPTVGLRPAKCNFTLVKHTGANCWIFIKKCWGFLKIQTRNEMRALWSFNNNFKLLSPHATSRCRVWKIYLDILFIFWRFINIIIYTSNN